MRALRQDQQVPEVYIDPELRRQKEQQEMAAERFNKLKPPRFNTAKKHRIDFRKKGLRWLNSFVR